MKNQTDTNRLSEVTKLLNDKYQEILKLEEERRELTKEFRSLKGNCTHTFANGNNAIEERVMYDHCNICGSSW